MKSNSIQLAAKALLKQIGAPAGMVNTQVSTDAAGPFIRVMVDPILWLSISAPSSFRGFRVVVEKREAAFAFG
jgi:hypothetical protein